MSYQFQSMDLVISRDGFYIREIEIRNVLGNITRFVLGDLVVKEDADAGFFTFEVPEGVRVIKEK